MGAYKAEAQKLQTIEVKGALDEVARKSAALSINAKTAIRN
jgi:hypothetical protein